MNLIKTLYILSFLFLFANCHNEKISRQDKIDFVILKSDYFDQKTETVKIYDSILVKKLFKEINSFDNKTLETVRPFEGSIILIFGYIDKDKSEIYESKYSTGIIIKKNSTFLITNYRGNFKNDSFANEIIQLFRKKNKLINY